MAWNRPSEEKTKMRGEQRNVHIKGLVAATVVVIGAAVAWWLVSEDEAPVTSTRHTTLRTIKKVPLAPAPRVQEVPVEKPREKTDEEKRQEKIAYYESIFGTNMPPAILALVRLLKNPPKGPEIQYRIEYPFLKHPAERKVANILFAQPGSYFVMRPNFGADFDQDFINSLVDKLEPEDGDTDEVKVIKRNIEAAKRDLAEICKREGKKPSEVMNVYADSLFDLGQFKHNLDSELNKIYANSELTDEEVKDFCDAANKMLESRGLDPIPYPDLTSRSLFYLHDAHELKNNGVTE